MLFHQDRVGRDGSVFRIHKLRTMIKDADAALVDLFVANEADGPLFKLRDDPRIALLSIDELPRLWNV